MCAPVKKLAIVVLPCHLVQAAVFFHALRSRRLPPQPPRCMHMQLQFQPLQLQRFLRSCALAAAHALATPPASVSRLLHARSKSRWIDCIFERVMSGFVARAEVRAACSAFLPCKRWHGSAVISLTHRVANAGGYPGATCGDAGASASLPTAVVFHAHALLVRRLPLPRALQAKTAFIKRLSGATLLVCGII
jgi:hypothetical protein